MSGPDTACCVETALLPRLPDRDVLERIRQALLDRPEPWKRVFQAKKFRACGFALIGESLKRPPRDGPADHPLIDDLKRTDFAVLRELDESDVHGESFVDCAAETLAVGSRLMRFLCTALGLAY